MPYLYLPSYFVTIEQDRSILIHANSFLKKHSMKSIYSIYFVSILLLILGCEGDQGKEGNPGINSLTNLSAEPPGLNCGNGGVRIDIGLDTNSNGVLDTDESLTTNYICDGLDGLVSLTDVIVEPIGSNCPSGGFRINSGLDVNSNGSLEENEISANAFLCNGLNGGNTLIRTINEPIGANCSNGGIKFDSGIDLNANNVLDEDEITSSAFLCNGENGNLSLINISDVLVNTDCPNGGLILDSGLDTNGNGILDESEILSTRNVCNGLDGMFNEEIRLVFLSGTAGSSFGTTTTEGDVLSSLQRFDIRRYDLLQSATFITRSWTEDSATNSYIELINGDSGEVIPNSTLTTNVTSFLGELLISPNIYENFPEEEITLSLRIRSENEGVSVFVTRRTELILNRGN